MFKILIFHRVVSLIKDTDFDYGELLSFLKEEDYLWTYLIPLNIWIPMVFDYVTKFDNPTPEDMIRMSFLGKVKFRPQIDKVLREYDGIKVENLIKPPPKSRWKTPRDKRLFNVLSLDDKVYQLADYWRVYTDNDILCEEWVLTGWADNKKIALRLPDGPQNNPVGFVLGDWVLIKTLYEEGYFSVSRMHPIDLKKSCIETEYFDFPRLGGLMKQPACPAFSYRESYSHAFKYVIYTEEMKEFKVNDFKRVLGIS